MSGKHDRYCHEMLAHTGFVILGGGMPRELRPDLWATRFNEGTDASVFMPRAERFLIECRARMFFAADLAGVGEVRIAAKAEHRLAERIAELTGRTVSNLRAIRTLFEFAPAPKVEKLPEGIPEYPSRARTEALEAQGLEVDPLYGTKLDPRGKQRQGIA